MNTSPAATTLWITDRGIVRKGSFASSPREVELSKPEKAKTTRTIPDSTPPGVAPVNVNCIDGEALILPNNNTQYQNRNERGSLEDQHHLSRQLNIPVGNIECSERADSKQRQYRHVNPDLSEQIPPYNPEAAERGHPREHVSEQ